MTRPLFSCESKPSRLKRIIFQIVDWLTYHFTQKIVLVYDGAQKACELKCVKNKVVVIRNGSDPVGNNRSLKKEEHISLIMTAQFTDVKDYEGLVRVFSQLKSEKPLKLHLVGDGPNHEKVRLLVKDKRLDDRVILHGQCSKERVLELLSCMDIFVLKTFREGLPVSIIEAMSVGLPIVSNSIAGIPELVEHGVNGFLYDIDDSHGMLSGLQQLIDDSDLRIKMGEKSQQRHESHFTLDRMISDHFALYEQLLVRG